jgi:hypothetical protein
VKGTERFALRDFLFRASKEIAFGSNVRVHSERKKNVFMTY